MRCKTTAASTLDADAIAERVELLDWKSIAASLDVHGCTVIGPLITPERCVELAAGYDTPEIFAAMSTWHATDSGAGNTDTILIRCRRSSPA